MSAAPVKSSFAQLAIAGGQPAFDHMLHVGRPNIGDREVLMGRITDILDRRWLTNDGIYQEAFERAVAERAGVRHCIATCNGTVALQLAIHALGLTGEVIVPAFTFVATAHALQWQGAVPVFCDVDPMTMQLDPEQAERLITGATSAIMPVHLWGQACDAVRLEELARRRGLRLLFDAAHAFGCTLEAGPVGSFGDAEVFSFHATKFVNSFEGGAVVTNDHTLADRLRRLRNFGFADYDLVVDLGINGKLSEPAAAMGLTSIESMDQFIARNEANLAQYRHCLADLPGIRVLHPSSGQRSNCQYVVIEVGPDAGLSRDRLRDILEAENIRARRYFYPGVHRMEPYRSLPRYADLSLPNTERLAAQVLCLPTGTAVEAADILAICAIIRLAVANASQLAAPACSAS